jgi:glycosyltransferase involved in cell wall biosynthesis/O-antigen/teichoic acid export membrane protein
MTSTESRSPALSASTRVVRTARRAASAPAEPSSTARSSVLLSASAGAVGVVSYACAVVLAHLLPPADFADFAAGQVLLTVVGTAAAALVPLPLAQAVRRHPRGSDGRRAAVAFAVFVALAVGCTSGVVIGAIALGFAGPRVALAVAGSAVLVCALVPVWGWLQGEGRFAVYAGLSVGEAGVRLATSVGVVAAGAGAAGALGGFAVGSATVLALAALPLLRDLGWRRDVLTERARWGETGQIAVVQVILSVLVAADVLAAAFSPDDAVAVAGYQALSTLAKAPVYVAAGTVLVAFPLLRAGGPAAREALRGALLSFRRIALLAAVVLATVPVPVAAIVLPEAYLPALGVLPWLALAGLGHSTTIVGATLLVAGGRQRRSRAGLGVAAGLLAIGLAAGHALGGVDGLGIGTAVAALGGGLLLATLAAPLLPAGFARAALVDAAVAVAGLVVLVQLRPVALLWVPASVAAAVGVLRLLLRTPASRPARPVPDAAGTDRLEILHLGFEDPAMPGSGGGSLRTHEIGRRIAAGHALTVLVQRFPGCVDRVQDGVHYVHVGIGAGRTRLTRVLGYMLLLPFAVRRRPADVVVEDFFAPVSSIAAPLWSGRPTLAMVQWLNAREKAAQYKVPVHLVERFGVRRHNRAVAVSEGIAAELRAVNPAMIVDVIGNGVPVEAFDVERSPGADIVFIGRLETAQKGLDLLLHAWARACERVAGTLVIAGTGPDEEQLRALADELGVGHRTRFVGWVGGPAKFALLASARVVAVPSRFETFGIVALEAAATGAPVVAFDIDCLREVLPAPCGRRTVPFDVDAYADALAATYHDAAYVAAEAERRAFARRFDWDTAAARQEQVYRAVAAGGDRSL